MPLYYFAYAGKPPPEEGEEFASDAAALAHAEVVADELSRHGAPRPKIVVLNKNRERIEVISRDASKGREPHESSK